MRILGDEVEIVVPQAAGVVVRAVETSSDAFAAIAGGLRVPTVLLIPEPHADAAFAAVRAGASAVLSLLADADELLAAIRAVSAGLVVLDGAVRDEAEHLGDARRARPPLAEPLTPREGHVLAMLADGLSNRRVAAALGISENTVKAHVAAILAKLGATTRTEAVTAGVRLGLVML